MPQIQIEELETNYRSAMSETLSQLQILQLLTEAIESGDPQLKLQEQPDALQSMVSTMQTSISQIGDSVKRLSLEVEEFLDMNNVSSC
jgi:uncharacterized protein (DUF3084 family)